MFLSKLPAARLWARQFGSKADIESGLRLLEPFRFVTADEFRSGLTMFIKQSFDATARVAFYVEREMQRVQVNWRYKRPDGRTPVLKGNKKKRRTVVRMYDEKPISRAKGLPKRWTMDGPAAQPVEALSKTAPQIGSEGVIANIISGVCTDVGENFVMHPHSKLFRDKIHSNRPRHLVVVTDLIGSGQRSREMLDSLWRVATIRSRKSVGYARMVVICYAGTDRGIKWVKAHRSRPDVFRLIPCPTIENSFEGSEREALKDLCRRFAPEKPALGHLNTAALISFDHSCPNNVPSIFRHSTHSSTRQWTALFPKRSTNPLRHGESVELDDGLHDALDALRLPKVAKHPSFANANRSQQALIVLLAAAYRGRNQADERAAATSLPLFEHVQAEERAKRDGFMTDTGRLTARAYSLINDLNADTAPPPKQSNEQQPYYYPTSLRAPK